MPLGGYRGAGW